MKLLRMKIVRLLFGLINELDDVDFITSRL